MEALQELGNIGGQDIERGGECFSQGRADLAHVALPVA